jgi:hypothetical protein
MRNLQISNKNVPNQLNWSQKFDGKVVFFKKKEKPASVFVLQKKTAAIGDVGQGILLKFFKNKV